MPVKRPGSGLQAARAAGVADYAAEVGSRCCAVCGAARAWWGFGPPLVPQTVWVCRAHCPDVDPEAQGLPDWLR